MGTDIYGWVEIRKPGNEWWDSAVQIHHNVHRKYGMFASLFGVRNGSYEEATAVGRFRAIAPGRSEPPGESEWYTREHEGGGAVGETWALRSELAAIDWDEEGEFYIGDEPPHIVYSGCVFGARASQATRATRRLSHRRLGDSVQANGAAGRAVWCGQRPIVRVVRPMVASQAV